MAAQNKPDSKDKRRRPTAVYNTADMSPASTSFSDRVRNDESWVEISSQPSSSSLSSAADDVITTGLHVPAGTHVQRPSRSRRQAREVAPAGAIVQPRPSSAGDASSQEEFDESESEEDRIITSSNENITAPTTAIRALHSPLPQASVSEDGMAQVSDDDEDRTAINYPIHNDACFTPLPHAFSTPSSQSIRPEIDVYFAQPTRTQSNRPALRQTSSETQSHLPQNILSPSYTPANQHDEALRTSLSTLLSCAAAARNLPKTPEKQKEQQRPPMANTARPRSNRNQPSSFKILSEAQLNAPSPPLVHEPIFEPTIRAPSTSSVSSRTPQEEVKRKAPVRSKSADRRASKKARRSNSIDELVVTPTLLTWAVSAGVMVALTALSFSAGYSLGKEAGRLEASGVVAGASSDTAGCTREATRSSLGLKRAMASSAVPV